MKTCKPRELIVKSHRCIDPKLIEKIILKDGNILIVHSPHPFFKPNTYKRENNNSNNKTIKDFENNAPKKQEKPTTYKEIKNNFYQKRDKPKTYYTKTVPVNRIYKRAENISDREKIETEMLNMFDNEMICESPYSKNNINKGKEKNIPSERKNCKTVQKELYKGEDINTHNNIRSDDQRIIKEDKYFNTNIETKEIKTGEKPKETERNNVSISIKDLMSPNKWTKTKTTFEPENK